MHYRTNKPIALPSMQAVKGWARSLLVSALVFTLALVHLAAPPPAHAQPLLLLWSRGPEVADWQRQLNGALPGDIAVDGIFGPQTAGATREFQRRAGIKVDGIVGPQTRGAMRRFQGAAPDQPAGDLLKRGDRGNAVRAIQERLESLNYWVGPVDGVYGTLTTQAVTAFQKVHGLSRDGIVGPSVRSALGSVRPPPIQSSQPGLVMEVNKGLQVLISVWNGRINHIWNTSTGTEEPYYYEGRRYLADTPEGRWQITRQIDGWRESNLGRLYRPKYFHPDGIAIHGYPNVPPYPASHGCVRVSMAAMDYLWTQMPVGTPVWVY